MRPSEDEPSAVCGTVVAVEVSLLAAGRAIALPKRGDVLAIVTRRRRRSSRSTCVPRRRADGCRFTTRSRTAVGLDQPTRSNRRSRAVLAARERVRTSRESAQGKRSGRLHGRLVTSDIARRGQSSVLYDGATAPQTSDAVEAGLVRNRRSSRRSRWKAHNAKTQRSAGWSSASKTCRKTGNLARQDEGRRQWTCVPGRDDGPDYVNLGQMDDGTSRDISGTIATRRRGARSSPTRCTFASRHERRRGKLKVVRRARVMGRTGRTRAKDGSRGRSPARGASLR